MSMTIQEIVMLPHYCQIPEFCRVKIINGIAVDAFVPCGYGTLFKIQGVLAEF